MLANDIVMDTIVLNATGTCHVVSYPITSNSGTVIEGFSVLANVTGDSAWRNQYS